MKDRSVKVANKQLAPLIKFAHNNRGTKNKLVKILSRRCGRQIHRENLDRWLHIDPAKRTQPLFGVGLLLVEIGDEYMREHNGHHTAKT
jgi:hypothetical protein